ncbi:BsuPI-related putative proteinase inhibitor [Pullulanibacillus sp. KACC 23026]|uniref:BsuPI-related putative proteinase inhibitor n=1 Tax=Pullulanibacillus sp. KACC 23026 TaxID=3028315 RepID=UPI0023B018C8|nr:BsuPI-related putative proteinase inhibitor [Pullulanibacillus sp. KACC 23026]WEG12298.1 BsuPI-related putative proteinase inhibitor [Pullulanibacillus sp. KACC 23026]
MLNPILTVDQVGQTCRFSFTVRNQTEKPLSLTFNTTQRFDYLIKDESGQKKEQFSDSHLFGQMVSTLTLKPDESLHYKGTLPKLEPGHYQITFWLSDDHYKSKIQQNFVVN